MITVEIDQAKLAEVQQKLAYLKNGAERALARALNKTASKAKTLASREIRNQVNLSAAYVRERLYGPAAGFEYRATPNKLTAKLSARKRGILMKEFTLPGQARKGRPPAPIRVKVAAQGSTITIASAFWVSLKSGNGLSPAVSNAVLRRLGMKHSISGNLSYTVLHGPSLSQVFTGVAPEISSGLNEVLADNLYHEMGWLLQKYPPPPDDGSAEE